MATIIRNILAFIFGGVIGSIVNMSLIILGSSLVPPPAGVDVNDIESLRAGAHLFEAKHFIFPFLAHAVGTLAGALAAFLIAGSYRTIFAAVIGVFFLVGGIAASLMIPAPIWFIALDLIVSYIPMALLAIAVGRRFVGR